MVQTLKAWSHSALAVFESCPYRAKLARIDKIPEPARPAPPNGKEHANDRGSRIHDHCESYVRHNTDLMLPEMIPFQKGFENLRILFKQGKVEMEDMWCYDDAWRSIDPKNTADTWLRVKVDVIAFIEPDEAVVIDHKTGRKFGNEIKHGEQAQLYQLAAFLRYPELEKVTTEFWYLDQDDISTQTYTRKQGLRFLKRFNQRGTTFTTTTDFTPKPNQNSCKFCPYGPKEFSNKWVNKSGHCEYGVN